MADKLKIEQVTDSVLTMTETASPKSAAETVTAELVQKTETRASRPSLSPSRSSMSTFFRMSKTFSKVVAPEYNDDDDDDDSDDDDDDSSLNTNDDDDDEPEDMQEGDEPMHDNSQNQASSAQQSAANTFSNVNPFLSQIKDPRGGDTARYNFVPEPAQPANPTTSKGVNPNEQPKGQPKSLPTTPEEPSTATAATPTTGRPAAATSNGLPSSPRPASATARPRAESGSSKPSSPAPNARFSAATTVRSSTASLPGSITSSTPGSPSSVTSDPLAAAGEKIAKPKVDPLAPTAAAPYGYKIVTVKKPDGTVAKVKRPLKEGETAPTPAPKPKAKEAVTRTVSQKSTQKTVAIGSIDASILPAVTEKGEMKAVAQTLETVSTVTVKEITMDSKSGVQPATGKPSIIADTKLPAMSEKQINDPNRVTVTEKELERVTSPRPLSTASVPGSPPEDEFKSARRAAMAFKIIVWGIGILLPLFFLALAIVTALKDFKPLPYNYDPIANPNIVGGSAAQARSTSASAAAAAVKDFFTTNRQTKTPVDPLTQAIKVAASAWPIVFAAVIAQTLKMYAAHKVERGIKLMQLEQLISSHSVGSALKQPFMLRTFNWTTIALFFIWCLSPLAGQSILRMVTTELYYDVLPSNITFFSSETLAQDKRQSGPWAFKGGYENDVPNSWFESSLLTALLQGYTQTQYLPQDIYRNLRIPVYRDPDATGPIYSADATDQTTFSSLVGYPFWINATYNTTDMALGAHRTINNTEQETYFNITTSYFEFDCSNFSVVDAYGQIMTSHKLFFDKNRTLTITAENNTKGIYVELPWYPPVPENSFNLLPGENATVPQNGTIPQSVPLNATTTHLPTTTVTATNTTSLISPTAMVNGTNSVVSIATMTSDGTVIVSPTSVSNATLDGNATQIIQQKDVQASSTSSAQGPSQTYYREPGPNGTLYYSTNKDKESVYFSTCQYKTVVVNTTFYCSNVAALASCFATGDQVRLPELEANAMPLGFWFPSILQNLGSINPNQGNYSQLEQFIVNPYFGSSLNLSDTNSSLFDAGRVTGPELSERLGLVANTVWALGLNEGAFMGPSETTWFDKVKPGSADAEATGRRYTIYVVSWGWLASLIVCSVLLTIAAISAAVYETRVVGPDFLGFANTAIKKNVKMPKNLSTMNARDRLLALQEVEVILQDVRPNKDIGRIALGVKDEESARLVPGRQYR